MRLVKCRKCGATVITDSTLLESMIDAMNDLNEKALRAKRGADKQAYIQQVSQLKKMIAQVQHRTAQLEVRRTTVMAELAELVHYVMSKGLLTYEELDEIRAVGRKKAEQKNKEDERVINEVYGEFKSNTTFNRSKADPTATNGIHNVTKEERRNGK